MQYMYEYILEAVGDFGPWQARKVLVLWIFMIILGMSENLYNYAPYQVQTDIDMIEILSIYNS